MSASPAQKKRLRGVILMLVQQQHAKQEHRHDDQSLMDAIKELGFGIHLNLVRELVQDLIERQCLSAEQKPNDRTGDTAIRKIQICPRGRDILERRTNDPGIGVEVE